METAAEDDEQSWRAYREQWSLRRGTTYLNHGSFGPSPQAVLEEQRLWKERMDSQPMEFFFRQYAPAWRSARGALANFIGAAEGEVVFVENATQGMNVVAQTYPLKQGDEVLLTDHEYGAVVRIWRRRCEQTGAVLKVVRLPQPLESTQQVVEAVVAATGPKTKIFVVSHITSPTALILPVQEVCCALKPRGVAVCIDGPHAPAQIPLQLSQLGCDFYVASCHKWLSASFGSGFMYVAPRWHSSVQATQFSWGLLRPDVPNSWDEEFIWTGTRDPSPYLSVPAAIDFLLHIGLEAFRKRTHWLAEYARQQLTEFADRAPLASSNWFGSMTHMPLPPLDAGLLQRRLWQEHGIEVPIIDWDDRQWIRVSCHLYNGTDDIDRLILALRKLVVR